MSPLEALEQTIGVGVLFNRRTNFGAPGRIVARMNPETREALSRLTSDDTLKVRLDLCGGDEAWYRRQEVSKMLMRFDRDLLRIHPA